MAFGFQIRDSSGNVVLNDTDFAPAMVKSMDKEYTFSGSESIPEFDDTVEMFFLSFLPVTVSQDFSLTRIPTIAWNNSTKTMTISPSSVPSGWPGPGPCDYTINFLTTTQRVDIT